jgi:hypothetical protein
MQVRPLPDLARELHASQVRVVVRALQELWVEHGALGDCSATAEDLAAILVEEIGARDVDFDVETLESESAGSADVDSDELLEGLRALREAKRKVALAKQGEERSLENVDAEHFSERAEELVVFLLNEVSRERLGHSLAKRSALETQRAESGVPADAHQTHRAGHAFFNLVLALYTAVMLRSERSKTRHLGCLLLARLPVRAAMTALALDRGKVVAILLREHSFLRKAAARALSTLLLRFVDVVSGANAAKPSQFEDVDSIWLRRLRYDQHFLRTLATVFRGLVIALEDPDDEVFAESLLGLVRLCRGRPEGAESARSPLGLHCFEILDASGAAIIARFYQTSDPELKSTILRELPGFIALSLDRHKQGSNAAGKTAPRAAPPQTKRKVSCAVDPGAGPAPEADDLWALSFVREFCMPMLKLERNLVRLEDEAAAETNASHGSGSQPKSHRHTKATERNESVWRAVVVFLLELACLTRNRDVQDLLASELPALQVALSQRELSSGLSAYLFRSLLSASMELLPTPEGQYRFLLKELELWPRRPRSCQTRANLMLLVSLTMDCAYRFPSERVENGAPFGASASAFTDVPSICRALFPPLRRNLLDSHLVRESDWNRLRDTLFCAMTVVCARLHTSLCGTGQQAFDTNRAHTNPSGQQVDLLSEARCHELTTTLHFLSNFREIVFRYHGLSAQYGDFMAALICLALQAVFYQRGVPLALQQVAIGFMTETLRDCARHVASPTALKIFSRGICCALPLLPPFEAENELYDMLVIFLEQAVARASALPVQRRVWRSSTGVLRFETCAPVRAWQSAETVELSGSALSPDENKTGAGDPLLQMLLDAGQSPQMLLRKATSGATAPNANAGERKVHAARHSIPSLLLDSDEETNLEEKNPADERQVPLRTLISEAAPMLYDTQTGTEYAEFVRRTNLELIGSIFEMQKRFPGANSRALRTYVQLAVLQIELLAESPSRAYRDDVFLDVAAAADSQLRFLRIGEYATPESRDALLRRVATKDDTQLQAFLIVNGGQARPLVAAHITDAVVDVVRALLLHEHLLMQCVPDALRKATVSEVNGLERSWVTRQPSVAAFIERFLAFVWPRVSTGPAPGTPAPAVQLCGDHGPLRIQAHYTLDHRAGLVRLVLDVEYQEDACGFADIRIGFCGDGDSSDSSDTASSASADAVKSPADAGWLQVPEQYQYRFFLRQSATLQVPLPLRRGVYYVEPIRVRVWWRPCDSLANMFVTESSNGTDAAVPVVGVDDYQTRAAAAVAVWQCRTAMPMALGEVPVTPSRLLLFCPLDTGTGASSLEFCYGLWDRCPAGRAAAMAPAETSLPAVSRSYLWVHYLLRFLETTFSFRTMAKAPDSEPQYAVLYARSRVHGYSVLMRLEAPLDTALQGTGSPRDLEPGMRPWILMHLRSEDALFLDVFHGHLVNALRHWELPLDVREHDERSIMS